jgi:hypothetical protein
MIGGILNMILFLLTFPLHFLAKVQKDLENIKNNPVELHGSMSPVWRVSVLFLRTFHVLVFLPIIFIMACCALLALIKNKPIDLAILVVFGGLYWLAIFPLVALALEIIEQLPAINDKLGKLVEIGEGFYIAK